MRSLYLKNRKSYITLSEGNFKTISKEDCVFLMHCGNEDCLNQLTNFLVNPSKKKEIEALVWNPIRRWNVNLKITGHLSHQSLKHLGLFNLFQK